MKYYEQGMCSQDRNNLIDMLHGNINRICATDSEEDLIKSVGYAQENINMLAYDRYLHIRKLKTCKNCKHYQKEYGFTELCDIVGEYFAHDAYCDQWEKRRYTKIIYCEDCIHYNEGKGQVCCDYCDPPYYYYIEREGTENVITEEKA